MITAEFFKDNGVLAGFSVCGHAGYADSGEDIVCASVSSAVQLAANLITEVFGADAEVSAKGDCVTIRLAESENKLNAAGIIKGLMAHLEYISEEFSGTIKITFSEV